MQQFKILVLVLAFALVCSFAFASVSQTQSQSSKLSSSDEKVDVDTLDEEKKLETISLDKPTSDKQQEQITSARSYSYIIKKPIHREKQFNGNLLRKPVTGLTYPFQAYYALRFNEERRLSRSSNPKTIAYLNTKAPEIIKFDNFYRNNVPLPKYTEEMAKKYFGFPMLN